MMRQASASSGLDIAVSKQGRGSCRRRRSGEEGIWGRGISATLASFLGFLLWFLSSEAFPSITGEVSVPRKWLSFLHSLSCVSIIVGHSSPWGILIRLWNPSRTLLWWFIAMLLAYYSDDYLLKRNRERNMFQGWKTFSQNNGMTVPKALGEQLRVKFN